MKRIFTRRSTFDQRGSSLKGQTSIEEDLHLKVNIQSKVSTLGSLNDGPLFEEISLNEGG